ncbi:queuosine precursor transporter [Halalkaliarchaeum sp. AArc-GB]|uniref:queuosine precursor transporter n=1 Tax=Halalkaliarchaeum sp. AArc-GB TaxID=3074078 RepID=UPI00285EBC5A|nr:queuosine precursor transporter [Halalkaliarchaeum sp. AArc-GB]MDR5673379.1 queuosine precursor transporter [Halalkaliarchaeum sp. AArc-GB]
MATRSVQTSRPTLPAGAVALAALFVASLVTAQLTASKVLQFELPFALPVTGAELALPGAALAYALTFLASDCYTELYGKRAAQVLVNVGFLMNFLVLALVWSTILAPAAPSSIDPAAFETVLGASTNIVAASLLAYVVSQNYDVVVFHWIKERTRGEQLWLRNIVSTGTSQAIDTVIFVGVAFWLLPRAIGLGPVLPGDVVVALMVGQYLLKLGIAVLDTPLVYLVVGAVRRYDVAPA